MEKAGDGLYHCEYCSYANSHHLPVSRHIQVEHKHRKTESSVKDTRLEKIASILTDYVGRLLGAKGMMKQRDQMREDLKKVMEE